MTNITVTVHRFRESDSSWCHLGVHMIKKGRVLVQVTFPKYYYFDVCESHAKKAGLIPKDKRESKGKHE